MGMPLQFGQLLIQIMRLMMSQEGSSFTSALKGLKKTPSIASSTTKTSRSTDHGLFQKTSFSTISSPRVNITTRKDLTLSQLFCEYQRQPHIQYVIRGKKEAFLPSSAEPFDEWVSRIDTQKCTDYQGMSRASQAQSGNKDKQSACRQQLKRQISQNLSKMTARLEKRQSQQPAKPSNVNEIRQFKYSFSEYFSEYSQLQHKDTQRQDQAIRSTKLDLIPASSEAIRTIKTNGCKLKMPSHSNKENTQLNGNETSRKIVGLQFSKNKRFKSTKKKRKALP